LPPPQSWMRRSGDLRLDPYFLKPLGWRKSRILAATAKPNAQEQHTPTFV